MSNSAEAESPSPRRRPGGRSARVRDAVVAATIAQLQESGFEGLSIGAVAALSGVNESSIYRRWKSKEGLVMEAVFELFAENIVIPNRGSLHADLVALMSATVRYLRTGVGRSAIQFVLATYSDAGVTSELHRLWTNRFAAVQQIFERATQRGEWHRGADPMPLLHCLIGAVYLRTFMLRERVTVNQLRELTLWLLRGQNA
ncbi:MULTISPECIES: TetR/AcrR family transcriptional regulator [Burkholderia]|uniref:TetR/AcrR family transcriptional regulator n=1 Tax=Burkholderia TaxID=32008 RepID=UPI00192A01A7|nr:MULTISPECIES: TetR/AcrR family transcriptional regulator [Burkholderia]MBL3962468.1 TetR/AcrR family transcriptional regulator [Burkholderia sp. KCJ3K979]MCF1370948.1 TetR/AcrR family transcriptional regulator [Burkholderia cenocepacia]MCF1388427.1 TetR/AcrR family transcriptional regulator [Burkholderia cenocepacia]MDR8028799.1 TetR/AcrR family transcriptional regulator [Burkholderia cenocepacia]MDR8039189.1 TetR/AcrR family transcriptional regulator [Burkholderia cenocepacia]